MIPDVVLFAAEEEVWFSTGNLHRFPGGEPHGVNTSTVGAASPPGRSAMFVNKPFAEGATSTILPVKSGFS